MKNPLDRVSEQMCDKFLSELSKEELDLLLYVCGADCVIGTTNKFIDNLRNRGMVTIVNSSQVKSTNFGKCIADYYLKSLE